MNNLEFDHADIFPDLAAIERQFHHLVRTVPASGQIILPQGEAALERVLTMGCWTPVVRFGSSRTVTGSGRPAVTNMSVFTIRSREQDFAVTVNWQLKWSA